MNVQIEFFLEPSSLMRSLLQFTRGCLRDMSDTVPAAYLEQKSVRNVRDLRRMVVYIERTGFLVLGHSVTDDSRFKVSRFSRNICMPAYKSVLSGFKTEI